MTQTALAVRRIIEFSCFRSVRSRTRCIYRVVKDEQLAKNFVTRSKYNFFFNGTEVVNISTFCTTSGLNELNFIRFLCIHCCYIACSKKKVLPLFSHAIESTPSTHAMASFTIIDDRNGAKFMLFSISLLSLSIAGIRQKIKFAQI